MGFHVGDRVRVLPAPQGSEGPFRQQAGQTGTIAKLYRPNTDYRARALVELDATDTLRAFHQEIALDHLEAIK